MTDETPLWLSALSDADQEAERYLEEQEPANGNGSGQLPLFENEPAWAEHWVDMPRFVQPDASPADSIMIHFRNLDDRAKFFEMIGYPANRRSSVWYPAMTVQEQIERVRTLRHDRAEDAPHEGPNRYPIYVISKGRWEKPYTVRALEQLGIDYRLVIEPQERDEYARTTDQAKHLILPFSNLGQGSIPARNWVWDHAERQNSIRHWILDDNLDGFYRLTDNARKRLENGNPFTSCEVFIDRYKNVGIAGLQYLSFGNPIDRLPPYYLNTRVYSCILIRNDLKHRWRGRYNEDTDLSLRVLKDGECTVLVNAYLCGKLPTMTMTGGNTDQLYDAGGRKRMAESLMEQHPDIVKVVWKWRRWQHQVDYSGFTQKLIKKDLS